MYSRNAVLCGATELQITGGPDKRNMHTISAMIGSVKSLSVISLIIMVFVVLPVNVSAAKKGFAPKPCLECHKEMESFFKKKNVHIPMANKACEGCHIRHGKIAARALIEREEIKLCYLCHTTMASDVDKLPHQHTALKQGKCLPCHEPHASDEKGLQKTGSDSVPSVIDRHRLKGQTP
jgi:predicted CXXCH cytochrome family protein